MARMEETERAEDRRLGAGDESPDRRPADAFRSRLRREVVEQSPDEARTERRTPNKVVWEADPGLYRPPNEIQEAAIGQRGIPFEDPRGYLENVNPEPRGRFRLQNCGDCARAVKRNWRGDEQVSAGFTDPDGELPEVIENWAGAQFQERDFAEVQRQLIDGGHGSSAVVGFLRGRGVGHVFNAINLHGEILAVDGQTGMVSTWPPAVSVMGFDETEADWTGSLIWGPNGKEIR